MDESEIAAKTDASVSKLSNCSLLLIQKPHFTRFSNESLAITKTVKLDIQLSFH